jgi:ComF family protein
MPRIVPPLCSVCGRPFLQLGGAQSPSNEATANDDAPSGSLCGTCRERRPAFSYARAAAAFSDVVREALHAFKFGGRRAIAGPFAELLAEAATACPAVARVDLLVPVPLHRGRQRERGFNQASLLATRLGRRLGIAVAEGVIVRTVPTRAQTELTGEERRRNVRGAFAVRRPQQVAGLHLLLIDDVMTTGATAEACADAALRASASTAGILTVARVL